MDNRLLHIFDRPTPKLSIYFTAGYPALDDTMQVLRSLDAAGVDFVELGMPFSDPLADGPVIQRCSLDAIQNGMTIKLMFEQIRDMRRSVNMPVILMGYINPVEHYGIEAFVRKCNEVGVDGVILPDLPVDEWQERYTELFAANNLLYIPLIAPQTPDDRIRYIDSVCTGFIYMVASAGITGNITTTQDYRTAYYQRVKSLGLRNKLVVGFGIKDHASYAHANANADGAIIGTAFVKYLKEHGTDEATIKQFVSDIRSE